VINSAALGTVNLACKFQGVFFLVGARNKKYFIQSTGKDGTLHEKNWLVMELDIRWFWKLVET
jgi:hypothetical protein